MAGRRARIHWTPREDVRLTQLNEMFGPNKDWYRISQLMPGRTATSCKKRWSNHLSPDVVHHEFTPEEDRIIFLAQDNIGKKWARIARFLPGRTGNAVRNYWRCNMKRKYSSMTNKAFNDFMKRGVLRFGLGSFVNPFNPTESHTHTSDSSVPELSLSLGLGYATAPKAEPVNLELSLALG